MRGILIDSGTGDLLVENGGLVIGNTESQTVETVLRANRGEFKEFPLMGGEVMKQLSGGEDVMWAGEVRKMLRACGIDCELVEIKDGVVTIK